jgi:hypothetical protein
MSRTPIVLSLVGLAFSVLGVYLMLRVLVPSGGGGMVNPIFGVDDAANLRDMAGPDVFSTYVVITAGGFAIFAAGLAMLFGRMRG